MFKRVDNQDMIQQKLGDGTIKRYVKGRLLGKGGFAKCYQVISLQTEKKYAAKIIQKASLEKSKAKQKLTSQIKIHKSLGHIYVVHFQHYFQDAEFVYILLQKCSNQTLNELLKRRKRLTDIETKYYVRQLAVAIKYIHDQQIIHRDLKLGNLFLSQKLQIKIGDFGLATKLTHPGDRKKTKCGTPNYIAPEILDDKKTHSYQVDVWSMGVITYALLVGKPPFQTNDVKDTYNKIKACNYSFPDSVNVSELGKSFISKMLQLDPSKRATIDEILSDPFLYQESIPTSLPISSLACPPSYDFLKKYREIEQQNYRKRTKNVCEYIQSEQGRGEDKIQSKCALSQQKNMTKANSRINSVQKQLKSNNRVLSAANLLSSNGKSYNKMKIKNDLFPKSLKVFVNYFEQNPKFGMGYILNSNAAGFKYNDSTAMVSNKNFTKVKYIEYDSLNKKLKQQSIIYGLDQAEQKEHKKYKILSHFYRQLSKVKVDTENQMNNQTRIKVEQMKYRQTNDNQMKCYVTRYHRTNKSTIFWLSLNAIQVVFEDSSQILVNSNGVITYVNKYKDRYYFEEKDKQQQPDQIKKRLLHFFNVAKNILVKKTQDIENKNSQSHKSQVNQKPQTLSRSNSTKLGTLASSNTSKHLKTSSSSTNIMEKSMKMMKK